MSTAFDPRSAGLMRPFEPPPPGPLRRPGPQPHNLVGPDAGGQARRARVRWAKELHDLLAMTAAGGRRW